jgi:hypothetical protein
LHFPFIEKQKMSGEPFGLPFQSVLEEACSSAKTVASTGGFSPPPKQPQKFRPTPNPRPYTRPACRQTGIPPARAPRYANGKKLVLR